MSQSQNFFVTSDSFSIDLRWWEKAAPHLNFQVMMVNSVIGPEKSIDMNAPLSYGIAGVTQFKNDL